MKRFSPRALALAATVSVAAFAACDGEGGSSVLPLGTPVQLSVTPTFDGPDQVPPALDPVVLQARVTDLTETTEFFTGSFEVVAGSEFEDDLAFEVPAGLSQVALFLTLDADGGVPVWAAGPDTILVPEEGEIGTVSPVFRWVGPGAGAARLELSPDLIALDAGDDTTLVVTAFDQAGNPIAGTTDAVDWVSLSTDLGDFVDQSGRWQSNGTRGEVQVVATLSPQQLADTSRIIVQPAPSRLDVLGGTDQSAPAGSALPEPVVVQVIASDGEPLAGRTVLFQPQNGGTVGQASVRADDEGLARTAWTLGPDVGIQTLLVQVEGRPEVFVEVSADATPVEFQAPTGVASTPAPGGAPPGGIEVTWASDDSNVELFRVQRSLDGGLSWNLAAGGVSGSDRSFVDAGPSGSWSRDQEVLHRVQGCDIEGVACSGWTVGAEPAYTVPNAPSGLVAEAVETLPEGTVLSVRWTDTNVHETGYDVCDSDSEGGSCTVQMLPADQNNVRFTTSVAGDSALITVTARNPGGEAQASVWVQLLTLEDFSIEVVSGDGQSGLVDSGLTDPVVVEVRDAFGALAEGVDVTFTARDGGAANPVTGITNAQGRASTTWTLGSAAGAQTLLAELSSAPSVFVVFSADAALAPIDAPTAVAASPSYGEVEFDGFTLSWESSDAGVERFRVERLLNGDESWTTVADNLSGEDRSFFDGDSFETDREVTYRVQGCDAGATNCSGFGVSAEPVYTPPTAPSGVTAEPTGADEAGVILSVSWTDTNTFEQSYTICGRASPGGACTVASVPADTETFLLSTSVRDSVYLTVTAVNETDEASSSVWVQVDRLEDFSIAVASGDSQVGTVGSDLPAPVVVEVRNAFGDLVEGLDVSFTAQNGGGATPSSASTNAQGRASTTWTLGPAEGTQTLTAALVDAPSVSVTAEAVGSLAAIDAPTAVAASPLYAEGTFDGFSVSWQSSDGDVERFRVERQLNGEGSWTTVADNLPSGDRNFFDGGSFPGDREVTYRVQGCNAAATNCSGFGVATAPVYTPPVAPSGVTAEITGTTSGGVNVSVDWTDTNSFETLYEVCDRSGPGQQCVPQALPANSETASLTTSVPDSVYITVIAVNETDETSTSIWLSTAPAAPSNVTAFPYYEEGFTGFEVDWSSNDVAADFFQIERSQNTGETWQAGVPNTGSPGSYVDFGPGNWELDQEVIYRVRACNDASCSDWTETVDPVYTLPRAPTNLSGDWQELTEDGPVLQVSWTDTNNFETDYDICVVETPGDACDLAVAGPDTEFKEFLAFVNPFADSVLVTVRASNPTDHASADIWIQLPGAENVIIEFFDFSPGSRSSPFGYRGMTFDNLDVLQGNLFIGSLNGSESNIICALNNTDNACGSDMGIGFDALIWGLDIFTGDDTASGVQGQLELELWDGSIETVDLIADGDPSTIEFHDLSSFGTIVYMTFIPASGSEMGIVDFSFFSAADVFPLPPNFSPSRPSSQRSRGPDQRRPR